MKDSPLVSVILTSFNHEKYLREAIDSVLNQTFTNFELIIWDDASSDSSWNVINEYVDHRIKVFRNEVRKRAIWGINKAISDVARGKYIAIHHSDDAWEPEKLEKQVTFLDTNANIGAVFTNALVITEDGSPLTDEKHFYFNIFDQPNRTRHEWLNHFFYRGNALCHPSVLIRKSCYADCGHYRYGLAQLTDFDMWIRLCLQYEIYVLPEKLVRFRVRDNAANVSGNRPETRIRGTYEFYKLLSNYQKLTRFDDLIKIFPSAVKYDRQEGTDMDFVLAMVALEGKPFPFTALFGLDLLFEIISNRKRSDSIKRLYDFDYKNFIALTAKNDVFLREEVSTLWCTIANRDGRLQELSQALAERDTRIASLEGVVREKEAQISQLEGVVREKEAQISQLEGVVRDKDASLNHIYNSHGWKVLSIYYRLRDKIFPAKTKRKVFTKVILNAFRNRKGFFRSPEKNYSRKSFHHLKYSDPEFLKEQIAEKINETAEAPEKPENALNKKATVAVVLLNYNCSKFIIPFFNSLKKQTLPPKEIILFDNGSLDGSLEYILKEYPEVQIVKNEKNLGFSVPNNQGIRLTHSEYILISNLDVILAPTFIEQMVSPLQKDPKIGWVAGKIYKLTELGPTQHVDCFAHHMQRDRYANALAKRHPNPQDPYYDEPGFRWGAPACCALYRRKMLEEVACDGEYFDEDFFAYFEDVDLDWRANLYGWFCYYQPFAIAYHAREGTKGVLEPKIMSGLVMNRFFMMIKNDRLQDIARDFIPIMQGTLFTFQRMFRECPRAFFDLFPKLVLIPRMLKKRRVIFLNKKVNNQNIRKRFQLKRSNFRKEILIFPVGPLNNRFELAKRVQLDYSDSSITLLLARDEEVIELPQEEGKIGYRLLSRCPLSYLKKPGVVPIYRNAWRRDFFKMAGLALLSGASPILVYGEGGELLEKKAAFIFLRQLSHVLSFGFFYPLARITRNLLPLISKLRRRDRKFSSTEKTWLIIPIYPDVSHHFIFQQVLHLSQRVPSEVVSVLKGELKYRAHYMEPLDQRIKYLPIPERLCIAACKAFFLLAFTRPRKLLEACLKIEDAARAEGEEIWSLRNVLSPFHPFNGLALYPLSKGQIPKRIHTYGLTIPTNYGLFFSMIFGIRQTATYYIDIPKGIPFRFFKLKKEKLQKVIVHTRHCIQELEELTGIPPEKIACIPFGASVAEEILIDRVSQPTELLAVGRLIRKKGFHILIEACEILKKKGYHLLCLIVGNGSELSRLRAAVKQSGLENWVTFLGSKSYDDYLSLLKPHRILIQPSIVAESGDHDGVPSVILDGMARGLIVIGTRIGGIPEAIQDNKNGFLAPANDPKALAECIEKVLTTREIHHRVSQAARSTILKHYDVKNLSKKMAKECGFIDIEATAKWWK